MKILYFGTACDTEEYARHLRPGTARPSNASVLFERALLSGLAQNGAQVELHSFPTIPAFPHSRSLFFFSDPHEAVCGYPCHWLHTFNIPIFRQISRRLAVRRVLRRWLRQNAGQGVILTYSLAPFLVKDVTRFAKRHHTKSVAIVADLLRDMYIHERAGHLLTWLRKIYLAPALRHQGDYDGYIYLTEAMRSVVAPQKPYLVMEAIADTQTVFPPCPQSCSVRAIMYAGALHEKYGIGSLLDAFSLLDAPDTELWLYGDGSAVEEILRRARHDPRIRYFGTVSHAEILRRERQATLLVNPRDPSQDFTRYSFPSKIVEYMLSGTPLVMTDLAGIPDAYKQFAFVADACTPQALAREMAQVLSLSAQERAQFGARARQFILDEKNADRQARRVLTFLHEVAHDTEI